MKGKVGTILPPEKPSNVLDNAQWLSGQGAGVWFSIESTDNVNEFLIQRFSPNGQLDCKRIFVCEQDGFDTQQSYQFTHISHCAKCRIKQNNQLFVFNWLDNENQ